MKLAGDLHCHTLASVHAYSTLRENLNAAAAKGIQVLGVTDHGTGCQDSPSLNYFENLLSLPEEVEGIRILRGVEANIMDYEGNLDMPDELLQKMDIVVASFHTACTVPGTIQQHTRAYLKIAQNPNVDIIGHSGSVEFEYEYEKVIPAFKKYGKVVEINAHTFICREKSAVNCKRIAAICKELEVPVAVNSDAHSEFEVGECRKAFDMLASMDFPEELIVNTDHRRLWNYLESLGIKPPTTVQEMKY